MTIETAKAEFQKNDFRLVLTGAIPLDVLVPGWTEAHVRPVGVYAFASGAFALLAFVDI